MGSSAFEIIAYLIIIAALAWPLGCFIEQVFQDKNHMLKKPLGWLERLSYKLSGVSTQTNHPPMSWKQYAVSLMVFNAIGFLLLLGLLLFQQHLPLNPAAAVNVPGWLAINTAISFVTNTNWQAYSGEVTLSYLAQMLGLGVQNFLSAATGMAVIAALARGLSRKSSEDLGNFWVDLTRSVVYLLLPLSIVMAIFLVSQGVIQNFSDYVTTINLDGGLTQKLPMGPAASQIAIKQLGSNGGGFFGVNSAHPFENPTPLSNFVEMLALLLIPSALPLAFGRLVGKPKHGAAIFAAMMLLFVTALGLSLVSEFASNPLFSGLPFLEGKELRFGTGPSVLWSVATTASSNGSVNTMHSSLSPLSGMIALINIMLGEVVFGGVGSGLYGMVLFVILTVFIAGLMVGRTPEYLGKKIESAEIKLAVIGILAPSAVILCFSADACLSPSGLSSLLHKGPHGLTEILYAFSSAAGNNGSAFAGLNANTPFYNGLLSVAMLIGRFAVIIPVLGIAGHLGRKKLTPASLGTFPTDHWLFVLLLVSVVIVVGALTFFPALTLGPIVEHFMMISGRSF